MTDKNSIILPPKKLETPTRRDVLKFGLAGLAGAAAMAAVPAKASSTAALLNARQPGWNLSFRSTHTHETFSGVYRVGNKYLPDAMAKISYILRDHRSGDVQRFDPELLDLVARIYQKTGSSQPLDVISGYRSPKTNAMLRRTSSGVAKKSFHMQGKAIDLRLSNYPTSKLRQIAISKQQGGVGYYRSSDFLHIDTGSFRTW